MPQLRTKRQRQLFEEAPTLHARVQLPLSVQVQLRQALVQWNTPPRLRTFVARVVRGTGGRRIQH